MAPPALVGLAVLGRPQKLARQPAQVQRLVAVRILVALIIPINNRPHLQQRLAAVSNNTITSFHFNAKKKGLQVICLEAFFLYPNDFTCLLSSSQKLTLFR